MSNGKQDGPFPAQEILNRNLDPSTYVLLVGTSNWKKISDTPELLIKNQPLIHTPPSGPQPPIKPPNIKKEMFSNPFSFYGRIRRTEYGISFIIYLICSFLIGFFIEVGGETALLMTIVYIPLLWFFWAQGAKRCHDRNNSGWYQLIPFYGFWMLFAEGDPGSNDYGESPK